jgi:uncharacterized membrane protein
MQKFGLNVLMIFLLFSGGVIFVCGRILNISISDPGFMMIFILLFSIIIVIHGWKTLGPRELLVFFLIAYSIPLLYEYTDGLGFGGLVGCASIYSDLLGPKFFGKVPYVIPLVWALLLYCAFSMTNIIFHRLRTTHKFKETASLHWFLKIIGMGLIAGLIMVSLDLLVDPVMVAMGAWRWSIGGSYFGIPVWNFEAWLEIPAVTFVIYSMYLLMVKRSQMYVDGEKKSRCTLLVVVLYLGALLVFGMYAAYEQVLYAIPWAAITMGPLAVVTIIRFYRSDSKVEVLLH